MARYTTSGALDATFDGDGRVTTDINAEMMKGMRFVLQADGKILVAGWAYNGTNDDIALVRYNTNGSLDMSLIAMVG